MVLSDCKLGVPSGIRTRVAGVKGRCPYARLKQVLQFFAGQVAIFKEPVQKTGADGLPGVNRNYSNAPVFMFEHKMTTSASSNRKTNFLENIDELFAGDLRKIGHDYKLMRYTPTKAEGWGSSF